MSLELRSRSQHSRADYNKQIPGKYKVDRLFDWNCTLRKKFKSIEKH